MKVYHIPRTVLTDWYGDVRGYIEEAAKQQPFFDAEDVYTLLASGDMLLSIAVEEDGHVSGCFVTELWRFPKAKVVNIALVGGETGFLASGFWQMMRLLEGDARERGVTHLTGHGRPGWTRVLGPDGWRTRELTSLWKELGSGEQESRPLHNH